jgi:hypothetical protein
MKNLVFTLLGILLLASASSAFADGEGKEGTKYAVPGDISVNEFLASNSASEQDESGAYPDWIEFYNNSDAAINLEGYYLSDDYADPMKFIIPAGFSIPAKGFIIVWADGDASTTEYIHTSFKLSATGEQIMISNASGTVLDSISFGVQTTDVSSGRCPDGTGSFGFYTEHTFNASNCNSQSVVSFSASQFLVYPNPADEYVTLETATLLRNDISIRIFDLRMQLVYETTMNHLDTKMNLNTALLPSGLYLLQTGDSMTKVIIR